MNDKHTNPGTSERSTEFRGTPSQEHFGEMGEGGIGDGGTGQGGTGQAASQNTGDRANQRAGQSLGSNGQGFGVNVGDLGSKLNDLGHKLRYLRRSRNDKVFGGIAGGIAEALGVETVVVRIAIVVLSVMSGVGFFIYLLAWAMIAKAPEGQGYAQHSGASFPGPVKQPSHPGHGPGAAGDWHTPKKMEGRQLMAVAIVSIGVLSLFNRMGINLNGDVLWPLALIGIGSAVLFSKSTKPPDRETPTASQDFAFVRDPSVTSERLNPYPANSPIADSASPKPTPDDLLNQARREVDELSLHESWLANPIGSVQSSVGVAERVQRHDRRTSKKFSRMILGTTLVFGGLLTMAIRSDWVTVGAGIDNLLAFALIGVGAVLFLGAWFGRPFGFLYLGAALFALLASASFVGAKWGDGVGQRTYQPKSLSELRSKYQLGAGTIKLDLTKIDFSKAARVVDVALGAGMVAVEVPTSATVAVATTTRGGEVTLFGKTNDDTRRNFRIGDAQKPQLTLNVRAGVGAIEVAQAGKLTKLTDLDNHSFFGSDSTDSPESIESIETLAPSPAAPPVPVSGSVR